MKRKFWIPLLGLLIVFTVATVLLYCKDKRCTLYPVRFGYAESLNFLPSLADDIKAYEENCIKIEPTLYGTGKQALAGLVAGDVDFCVAGLGPYVYSSVANDSLQIIASVATFYNLYHVLAREDRGIHEPIDLIGKTIGTTKGSSIHYFLNNFLLENRIPEEEVHFVFDKAGNLTDLMISGKLDAICLRDPYLEKIDTALKGKINRFSSPELPSNTLNIVTTKQFIRVHPEVVYGFIAAIYEAELAYLDKTDGYKVFYSMLSPEMKRNWSNPETRLHVSLEQNLILEMENIARWMVRMELMRCDVIPDYQDRIDTTFLAQANPHAITIIQ